MPDLELIKTALKLKSVKRSGWVYKEISNPESVADHSYGISFLALFAPLPKGVNRDSLIKMALLHDLSESNLGDPIYETGKFRNLKKYHLILNDKKKVLMDMFGKNYPTEKKLALDYLQQKTPEAKFLKELDKLESVLQALTYEKNYPPERLNEFWENAELYIKDKQLLKFFEQLRKERLTSRVNSG